MKLDEIKYKMVYWFQLLYGLLTSGIFDNISIQLNSIKFNFIEAIRILSKT